MDPGQAQVDLDPTWNLTCRFRSKQIQIKQIQVIADPGQKFHFTFRSQVKTFKQYITCFHEFYLFIHQTYCWSTDRSVIWPVGSGQNRSRSQWIMIRADPGRAFFGCLTCRYRSRSPVDQSMFSLRPSQKWPLRGNKGLLTVCPKGRILRGGKICSG